MKIIAEKLFLILAVFVISVTLIETRTNANELSPEAAFAESELFFDLSQSLNDIFSPRSSSETNEFRVFNVLANDCWSGAEKNGAFCYPKCKAGFHGVGPVCWGRCPAGYTDDGATCRSDVKIISANNSKCPWYDKCGLTLRKGCSVCPAGFKNDGCTCRRDVHIISKPSYGRGAGYLTRSDYRGIFYRYIRDHRNIWMKTASPLTEDEKKYLLQFFPQRLVDAVRVKELAGMTGAFNHSYSATTYGNDFIIIRKGRRSLGLLKHEFVHVCQYDRLGLEGFAHAYADQWIDGGYQYANNEFELQAKDFVTKEMKIGDYLGYCKE